MIKSTVEQDKYNGGTIMKKILAFLLCAVMMLSVCVAAFPAHAADNCTDGITPGDVNGDGSVGMKDIIILIRFRITP